MRTSKLSPYSPKQQCKLILYWSSGVVLTQNILLLMAVEFTSGTIALYIPLKWACPSSSLQGVKLWPMGLVGKAIQAVELAKLLIPAVNTAAAHHHQILGSLVTTGDSNWQQGKRGVSLSPGLWSCTSGAGTGSHPDKLLPCCGRWAV